MALMNDQAPKPLPALGRIFQLGVIVPDIEAAMRYWMDALGVGPFTYMDSTGPIRCTYRGKQTDVRICMGFSYSDNLQIELIQQRNDAPSPYRDFLASGREGVQHVAHYAHDFDAAGRQLEAGGARHVYTIEPELGGERIHYYERPGQATMIELVPLNDLRRRYHEVLQNETRNWDGGNPIRRYRDFLHFYQSFGLL